MNKLIEKAKQKANKKLFTKDEVELALAYSKGEITVTGVATALGIDVQVKPHQTYSFLARALRQHYSNLI
jgi:hypothetical protein